MDCCDRLPVCCIRRVMNILGSFQLKRCLWDVLWLHVTAVDLEKQLKIRFGLFFEFFCLKRYVDREKKMTRKLSNVYNFISIFDSFRVCANNKSEVLWKKKTSLWLLFDRPAHHNSCCCFVVVKRNKNYNVLVSRQNNLKNGR